MRHTIHNLWHSPLPSMRALGELAELISPFPIENRHITLAAERFGFNDQVMTFLEIFPRHKTFQSREAFLEHCELLRSALLFEDDSRTPVTTWWHVLRKQKLIPHLRR